MTQMISPQMLRLNKDLPPVTPSRHSQELMRAVNKRNDRSNMFSSPTSDKDSPMRTAIEKTFADLRIKPNNSPIDSPFYSAPSSMSTVSMKRGNKTPKMPTPVIAENDEYLDDELDITIGGADNEFTGNSFGEALGLQIDVCGLDEKLPNEIRSEDEFSFSDTGTFTVHDMVIKDGIQSHFQVTEEWWAGGGPTGPTPSAKESPLFSSPQNKKQTFLVKSTDELELLEPLGRGAGGSVRRAIHKPSGRELAIKSISVKDNNLRKQFKAEIVTLFKLKHENLVELYGVNVYNERVLLSLEYCSLGSLRNLVEKDYPITLSMLVRIYHGAISGLAYLHEKFFVHRDIKPDNILVTEELVVKLADFGIVRTLASDDTDDYASTVVGTLAYMSPEMLQSKMYGFATDIWSMGVTYLFLLLRKDPYDPNTGHVGLKQLIVYEDVPEFPAETPETIKSFLRRCLVKHPRTRAKASELLEDPLFHSLSEISPTKRHRIVIAGSTPKHSTKIQRVE